MTLEEFKLSLSEPKPPDGFSDLLRAMWYEANNDWKKAHDISQEIPSEDGSWVHAYLHRKEGDHGNAGYWYRRAGRPTCRMTLEEEWEQITADLLAR